MKDLLTYCRKAEQMLNECHLNISNRISYEINSRAIRRWGLCKHNPDGSHTIEISNRLLEDTVSDEALLNTICHEIIHTIKGCNNHGPNFKKMANIVNAKFGLNVKTRTSAAEKGLEHIEVVRPIKHKFICEHCGMVINRTKESNFTKHYKDYTCSKCGGTFKKEF